MADLAPDIRDQRPAPKDVAHLLRIREFRLSGKTARRRVKSCGFEGHHEVWLLSGRGPELVVDGCLGGFGIGVVPTWCAYLL